MTDPTLPRAALREILATVKLLRRSCDGWVDDPMRTPVARMTLADLRAAFAHLEVTARIGLGASPEMAAEATRR